MWVAIESWLDDDGDWIVAGKTVVSERADCFRKHPGRFKRFTRDFGRSTDFGAQGELVRLGELTHFVGASVALSHGRRRRAASVTVGRPAWQLQREPWRLT